MSVFDTNIVKEVERLPDHKVYGQVTDVIGLLIEAAGVQSTLSVGDHCDIIARDGHRVRCEVIGFSKNRALLMPFGSVGGIGMGCRVEISASDPVIYPDRRWLGRVINAFGEPMDGKGPLPSGNIGYPIHNTPPPAHERMRVGGKIDLGVRVMNTFLTCCKGQRLGIFAGSGVGKSTLLSMMARHTSAEVSVVGMIGERSREAREFIEDHLGPEGMAHSVVIVATSDESPLIRRQAAYVTMAVSEYFRDQNNEVLCLMDSVTRFAMAQREISLSMGEPPASKGYTPTVFAELPRLLERAGPGTEGQGSITGLFTVLVEGDDHNEPVADAVRGILDGHVVLDRDIAERGRFPPVNILRSLSRTMPACNSPAENAVVNKARHLVAIYEDMAELIRLGAYRRGSDPKVDEAVHYYPALEKFLSQDISDQTDIPTCYQMLNQILDMSLDDLSPDPQAPVPEPAAPDAQPVPVPVPPAPAAAPAPAVVDDMIAATATPAFQNLPGSADPETPDPETPSPDAPEEPQQP
ncbi:MAG: flagellar protein export ATPase FliI [Alphaproteobacteria bacterium]|nr:flagellar protein export ATPase FliI [Alphaproteobacteria bacterium]